jgi:chemotaxis protein CheC
LKRTLKMSLPVVVRGDSKQMFASAQTPESLILFLHITFEISNREITGYVALVMDIPSIDEFRALIADFMRKVASGTSPI